ncbi:hypothetical protein BH11ACT7_BH11ACT7_33280 [soil metagenome]
MAVPSVGDHHIDRSEIAFHAIDSSLYCVVVSDVDKNGLSSSRIQGFERLSVLGPPNSPHDGVPRPNGSLREGQPETRADTSDEEQLR